MSLQVQVEEITSDQIEVSFNIAHTSFLFLFTWSKPVLKPCEQIVRKVYETL